MAGEKRSQERRALIGNSNAVVRANNLLSQLHSLCSASLVKSSFRFPGRVELLGQNISRRKFGKLSLTWTAVSIS